MAGFGLPGFLGRLGRDKAGAISALAGVSTAALLGLAGLAVEAGYWYVGNRQGQNAADVAAVAGAMTWARSNNHDSTLRAGTGGAARNGFVSGGTVTVTINHPPTSGSYTSNNNAVEAIIGQAKDIGVSRLFGVNSMTVTNRAVAVVTESGEACILSLRDSLILTGTMTVTAPNCILAGNKEGQDSIIVSGSSNVDTGALVAMGECDGCNDRDNVSDTTVVLAYTMAPTRNPFAALNTQTWPSYSTSDATQCDNTNYGNGAVVTELLPTASSTANSNTETHNNGGRAYCGGLHMTSTDAIDLKPGIYMFYEADIQITGGTLTCSTCTDTNGVHIVQIDRSGHLDGLQINSGATVTLKAGSTIPTLSGASPAIPPLTGVLYHRTIASQDDRADEVIINGGSDTVLIGGIYTPSSTMRYNGDSTSSCSVIVGAGITLNGTTTLDQTGCTNIGLVPVKARVVVLVE